MPYEQASFHCRPSNIIVDPSSGMNHHKKGLRRLLDEIMAGD